MVSAIEVLPVIAPSRGTRDHGKCMLTNGGIKFSRYCIHWKSLALILLDTVCAEVDE